MTVQELINMLLDFPLDSVILDEQWLELTEVEFHDSISWANEDGSTSIKDAVVIK